VQIHQTLGGSYTVQTDFACFRIDGKEGDALGRRRPSTRSRPHPGRRGARPQAIWEQLRRVYDPEIPVNIVDLGLVYSMDVERGADNATRSTSR